VVEFRTLEGGNQANNRVTTLDFQRTDFGLFRELLERIPWNIVLERRRRS